MVKIGVIGIGNIGKRHIQSIGDLKEDKELFCYDNFKGGLDSLDGFLIDNNIKLEKVDKFNELDGFLEEIDSNTIIIIATTAKGRAELIERVLEKRPRAILVEKPVCQTLSEYEKILKNYDGKVPIYVNFAKRCYPVYRELKKELGSFGKIKEINVHLDDLGMACVGIHLFDLIQWLLGVEKFEIISAELYEKYESKRKGFFDFSGKVEFLANKNIKCCISNSRGGSVDYTRIITEKKIIDIYELSEKLVEITNDSIKVDDFKIPYQSQLTSKVIKEILDDSNKEKILPDIKEAFLSHKILFEVMQMNDIIDLNIT